MPLNPAQIALLMARLPAASQQALEFLAKTKGKTPQEVFEECLREYIAGRVPQVRSLARAWQDRNDKE